MTHRPARRRRGATRRTAAATSGLLVAGLLATTTSVAAAPAPAATVSAPKAAATVPARVPSEATVGGLLVENSFVSSVGWVKPGEKYPSRILLTNTSDTAVPGAEVTVTAPQGTRFTDARGGADGTDVVAPDGRTVTWSPDRVGPKQTRVLVLEAVAATTADLPTVVWRDLSSTATVTAGDESAEVTSHGPKVIPPGDEFDTARYGDRPFPIVPVAYTDRDYGEHERTLDTVINDPAFEGSTFNLFQEMSLGQLYPEGTVPSAGVASADFDYEPGFDFTQVEPGQTCTAGATVADSPIPATGTPLYPERIQDGVYQLPGNTAYYGADANGSALAGALAGVGALQSIDSGCGPTGKLVRDAAAIADPEVDYSDFDTDKDGVVDFFMAVFAGCGGNGASQLSGAGCDLPNPNTGQADAPYDNVWPHSSSLEFYYSDPETGLPGFTTDDQLKDLEGRPLWYTDDTYSEKTAQDMGEDLKVFVRVGPYNVNPETAIDAASVISHEYGHSLGLPDFYSTGSRGTYGDWSLMATDKSHHIDAFGRQELGWVVPQVLDASRTAEDVADSKQDINTITWQTPGGTPYTLVEGRDGVGRVQNSEMYVAKLPGRVLLDPAKFETGDTATPVHTWWSRSGNDFGCAKDPGKGHNLDLAIPEVADLPEGTTLSLDLKSMWDIEWDYDYGFVLTSTDGGKEFSSNPSENGYTTSNTDPAAGNPNQNACQAFYDHGLTGTSGSYQAGTEATDRKLGETPESVYLADSYDVSELVGAELPVLRFSYATDPGLARPGWFIDDVSITATLPDGTQREIYATDFESSGDEHDPRIFNGGCQADGPGTGCTQGWQYVAAGAEGPSDHAYYLELRDRSGFDLDGNGQADRGAPGFASGLYVAYTDEAHGYGNVGTDDPPAQSPLDSQPQPGEGSPELDDAAWTAAAGDDTFTDSGAGHTDNYSDPTTASGNWEFRHDCLTFDVLSMSGNGDGTVAGEGPATPDGDLTGDIAFTMSDGCGAYDYGYGEEQVPPQPGDQAPTAEATATPTTVSTGEQVILDGRESTDPDTEPGDLHYAWDFGDGGESKDSEGARVAQRYAKAGTYTVTLRVTDPQGGTDTDTVEVTVTGGRAAQPAQPQPARTARVGCQQRRVDLDGSWRVVRGRGGPGGEYCDNRGRGGGRDVVSLAFRGGYLDIHYGQARRGGVARIVVDGERRGTLRFDQGRFRRPRFGSHRVFRGLGPGRHRVRLVMTRGTGYLDGFAVRRR